MLIIVRLIKVWDYGEGHVLAFTLKLGPLDTNQLIKVLVHLVIVDSRGRS